jgi:hypothetical protein
MSSFVWVSCTVYRNKAGKITEPHVICYCKCIGIVFVVARPVIISGWVCEANGSTVSLDSDFKFSRAEKRRGY